MVLAKAALFFFLSVVVIGFAKSNAAVYKVGDAAGWTNVGNVDYKTWASTKNFHVGDVIVFEYNKQFHNVVRVTHKNFNACNSGGAFESHISGNDSFVIKKTGHFYFICSVPGHCESGQKVDIRVPGKGSAGAPSTSKSPSPSPSPTPMATPPTTARPKHSPHPAPPTTANPPVVYEAPATAPSNTSASSFIESSKALIVLSALNIIIFKYHNF